MGARYRLQARSSGALGFLSHRVTLKGDVARAWFLFRSGMWVDGPVSPRTSLKTRQRDKVQRIPNLSGDPAGRQRPRKRSGRLHRRAARRAITSRSFKRPATTTRHKRIADAIAINGMIHIAGMTMKQTTIVSKTS
jgi:hypothetical protein